MIRFVQTALVAALLCVLPASWPAFAQSDGETSKKLDTLFGDHVPYEDFLAALQKAVADADKPAIAEMVSYPLKTEVSGKMMTLKHKKDFIAHYDAIVTAKIAAAIRAQTYPTLFVNSEGAMIGSGEVWFSGICSDTACAKQVVKIIAFNQ